MTDKKHKKDEYELPTGIIFQEDNSTAYPNLKRGIIFAVPGGFFGAFALWLLLANKAVDIGYRTALVGFVLGFLMAGAIAAFRPPKN